MNIDLIQKHLKELKDHQAYIHSHEKLKASMYRSLSKGNRPWASNLSVNVIYEAGNESNDWGVLFTEGMNDYFKDHKKQILEHIERYVRRKTEQLEKQVKQDMIENLGLKL